MTHQLLVLKLIQRETIACLGAVVVALDVGDDAWAHHQLHITGRSDTGGILVFGFEFLAGHSTVRNDTRDQNVINNSNQSR